MSEFLHKPSFSLLLKKTMKPQTSEFIDKLLAMLSDETNHEWISWTFCGTMISLRNPKQISHQVLPKYFNHTNYASLIRQLNYYGFKKVPTKFGEGCIYRHPSFQQGNLEAASQIHRKKKSDAKISRLKSKDHLKNENVIQKRDDTRITMTRVQILVEELNSVLKRIDDLCAENVFLRTIVRETPERGQAQNVIDSNSLAMVQECQEYSNQELSLIYQENHEDNPQTPMITFSMFDNISQQSPL